METTTEPNWKEIALTLAADVTLALYHLKSPGGGLLFNSKTGVSRHWKQRFADSLELIPGNKVDREAMFALDMPKRERVKWFKDRAATKLTEATAPPVP